MNDVMVMQMHWPLCGQQKKQATLWPTKQTGHFVANEINRPLCGQGNKQATLWPTKQTGHFVANETNKGIV